MLINLNEFLVSLSFAIDFLEMDVLGNTTNHSKRVAYISYQIGKQLAFSNEQLFDLISLSILHDNGICEDMVSNKSCPLCHEAFVEHCIQGEKNLSPFPFYSDVTNVIKYHHEHWDGTGFFKKKGDEIPLFSQIIHTADCVDHFMVGCNFRFSNQKLINYINNSKNVLFSERMAESFLSICHETGFYMDLDDKYLKFALARFTPKMSLSISIDQLLEITKVYLRFINCKSPFTYSHTKGLAEKASIMADHYNMDQQTKKEFIIAARLHDIGKLGISNQILDKPAKLTSDEFDEIKKHVYYTNVSLGQIHGFEKINMWASNHHERLDGSGYPYGLRAYELDFNSRLLAVLDICQALMEERPYRIPMPHSNIIEVLTRQADQGKLDHSIVLDVINIFLTNH